MTIVATFVPVSMAAFQGQSGFVPASQLPTETLPSAPLVFAAYAVAWLAVLAYVVMLWRRAGRIQEDLAELRARLARQPAGR